MQSEAWFPYWFQFAAVICSKLQLFQHSLDSNQSLFCLHDIAGSRTLCKLAHSIGYLLVASFPAFWWHHQTADSWTLPDWLIEFDLWCHCLGACMVVIDWIRLNVDMTLPDLSHKTSCLLLLDCSKEIENSLWFNAESSVFAHWIETLNWIDKKLLLYHSLLI